MTGPQPYHSLCHKTENQLPVHVNLAAVLAPIEITKFMQEPSKHAGTCKYWACTGQMLPASAQYRPGTGT